jgi:hypothetical protein
MGEKWNPYRAINKLLNWAGLSKAAKEIPSFLLLMLVSVVVMELVLLLSPIEYRVLGSAQIGLLVSALAVALISASYGDYWDKKVFDRRYGLQGTWLTDTPWAVFRAGSDLKDYRDRAIEKLKLRLGPGGAIDQETGKHVYRESKGIVQTYPSRWERVDGPNHFSKFCRNLILPLLVAAVLFLVMFLWKLAIGDSGLLLNLVAGAVCLVLAILLFVPYFNFKVEHMIRLYREVVEVDGRARSGTRTKIVHS